MVGTDRRSRRVDEESTDPGRLVEQGRFAELAADHNPDTIVVIDPEGTIRYAGGSVEDLIGVTPEAAVAVSVWDFVHPADLESAAGALNEASRSDGYHMPTAIRVRERDGGWVDTEVTATTFGAPGGVWLVLSVRPSAHRDEVIGRRRQLESLVRDASTVLSGASWRDVDEIVSDLGRRLAEIVGADSFAMAWTEDGELRYGAAWPAWIQRPVDRAFEGLWSRELLAGSLMQYSDDLPSMPSSRIRDLLIVEGVRAVVEVPISGEPSWGVTRLTFRRSFQRWDDANVDLVKVLSTAVMSTVRRCRVERTLHERASTDPLTGLMNRTELYRRLDSSVAHTANSGHLAVLFADLDNFKMVNDVYGHAAGDDLLISVAEVLRSNVRGVDVIARLGGDEFVVVCPELEDLAQVDAIAERITAAVEALDTGDIPLSISIGVAILRDGETGYELLQRADRQMYVVKELNRSGVEPVRS